MRTTITTLSDNLRSGPEKVRALGIPVWSEDDLDAALGGLA